MNRDSVLFSFACILLFAPASPLRAASPAKVAIIAGPIAGHPKHTHEYEKNAILLKHLLDTTPGLPPLRSEVHFRGWPEDPRALDDADTIVLISDGGDRKETDHPFYLGDRLSVIEKQMRRGCGLVLLHWSTFNPTRVHDRITEWAGGYFDYETGPAPRRWRSEISTADWTVTPASPQHPICRGVKPFPLKEEFYYKIRFGEGDPRLVPIATVDPAAGLEKVVGWAVERKDGGRGFGFTGGHFFENWRVPGFRKFHLNAVLWTARAEVPAGGVESAIDPPLRALILTGHNHPAHDWRAVTAALIGVLEQDPRVVVDVSEEIEDLATDRIRSYGLLVLNYANWERSGLSDAAKRNFVAYLEGGGGLAVIHFANGAFNSTLPPPASDWEEYRTRIVRRAWMHGENRSGHDPFGPFRVEITSREHPITKGLAPFETEDELYFRQEGPLPIEPLAAARSKVTGRDEPMAWAYDYGRGRVFQTVLGHSDRSIRAAGALIRRGASWAAGGPPLSFDPPARITEGHLFRDGSQWSPERSKKRAAAPPLAPPGEPARPGPRVRPVLAPGRFGQALDARHGGVVLDGNPAWRAPPFTVECWARVESKRGFNILIASEVKSSLSHWEIYTFAGSGRFSAYLPGRRPAEIVSSADVCDGKWHHLAMVYEPQRVRLLVDGRLAADQTLAGTEPKITGKGAPVALGTLVERTIGCDGQIDEARVSSGVREFPAVPDRPNEPDAATLGLTHADSIEELSPPPAAPAESSSVEKRASAPPPGVKPPNAGLDGGTAGHWGLKDDKDWFDPRVKAMDYGPFFSSSLETPAGTATKAISLRLGPSGEAAVVFDAAELSLKAGWTGGFLTLGAARFGLIEMPKIAGLVQFAAPRGPAWDGKPGRYKGLRLSEDRVILSYSIDGAEVLDAPSIDRSGSILAFHRTLEISASTAQRRLWLIEDEFSHFEPARVADLPAALARDGGRVTAVVLVGPGALDARERRLALVLGPSPSPRRLNLITWRGAAEDLPRFGARVKLNAAPDDLAALSKPAGRLRLELKAGRGQRSARKGPYAIDTIPVPHQNPDRALMYLSGHDFFSNGDAAVATAHGDVWLVRGIDDSLESVRWQRFATGLYQPLGLKVVGDKVHVLGRDQITVLEDENSDGEADFYRNLCSSFRTLTGGHDYSTCLETDAAGNFYFVNPDGLWRISPDGRKAATIAGGFRNANGLSVGPNGLSNGPSGAITVAPQEGEWTPASQICEVKPGGWYGYPGPRSSPQRPLGYDPPLCYIPRHVDNSTGGQVWVASEDWGPLQGRLLNLSFGRSSMQLVLRETVEGMPQGGVVPLKGRFLSGAMRGRFHPRDGQLYVTGMNGWVTNAVADGCFQRVRYTGAPVYLPVELHAHANGLRLAFTEPLSGVAEDPASYRIEVWSYRYGPHYGSEEYSIAQPDAVGHDAWDVRSVRLLDGGRGVFLEAPSMRPVMQIHLAASLEAQSGGDASFDYYGTVHRLRPPFEPPPDATAPRRSALPAKEVAKDPSAKPGLVLTLASVATGARDARISRLAALGVPAGTSASPFLVPGAFRALWEGRLQLDERDSIVFSAAGRGALRLSIDGRTVLSGEGDDLARITAEPVRLEAGGRDFRLEYASPAAGDAFLRLYWSGQEFAREAVPATAFSHANEPPLLEEGRLLREGREAFARGRCLKCHESAAGTAPGEIEADIDLDSPSFEGIGSRLSGSWMAHWIAGPRAMRPSAAMPHLLGHSGVQEALKAGDSRPWDLAAYLATLRDTASETDWSPAAEQAADGGDLFAGLGCIACHSLPGDPDFDRELNRVPLGGVAWKWKPAALRAFLLEPTRHYRSIRMPGFKLTEAEAGALAAFLLRKAPGRPDAAGPNAPSEPAGDAGRGRMLAETLGCLSCHRLPPLENRSRAASLNRLKAKDWRVEGCCAPPTRGKGRMKEAMYRLSERERSALARFAASGLDSLGRAAPLETGQRLVASLNCRACHDRDGEHSRWSELDIEARHLIAREPSAIAMAARPPLTHAGDQLRADWMERLFSGRLDSVFRPWLKARMPRFPAQARALARGLALEHGRPLVDAPETAGAVSSNLAEIGRLLLDTQGGFGCVSCHPVGHEPARMQLHFGVVNLREARERLHREFYMRWMMNPQRVSPLTPMPAYADEEGVSVLTNVLEGSAARQFEAVWEYLGAAK